MVLANQVNIEISLQRNLDSCRRKIRSCECGLGTSDGDGHRVLLVPLRTIEQNYITALEAQRNLVLLLTRKLGYFLVDLLKQPEGLTLRQAQNLYVASDTNLHALKQRGDAPTADVTLFEECARLCRKRMQQLGK